MTHPDPGADSGFEIRCETITFANFPSSQLRVLEAVVDGARSTVFGWFSGEENSRRRPILELPPDFTCKEEVKSRDVKDGNRKLYKLHNAKDLERLTFFIQGRIGESETFFELQMPNEYLNWIGDSLLSRKSGSGSCPVEALRGRAWP